MEETGLRIEPIGIIQIDRYVSNENEGSWLRIDLIAKLIGGNIKTYEDEHSKQAKWFGYDEAKELEHRSGIVMELIEKHYNGKIEIWPMGNITLKTISMP